MVNKNVLSCLLKDGKEVNANLKQSKKKQKDIKREDEILTRQNHHEQSEEQEHQVQRLYHCHTPADPAATIIQKLINRVRPIPVSGIGRYSPVSVGVGIGRYFFSIGADTSSSFTCLHSQHCCMHASSFKPIVCLKRFKT